MKLRWRVTAVCLSVCLSVVYISWAVVGRSRRARTDDTAGNITVQTVEQTVGREFSNGDDEIRKFISIKPNEVKNEFVNIHDYVYSITSDACTKEDPFLLMVVHSAPANKRKRFIIRSTFGSVRSFRNTRLAVVFMTAAVRDKTVQRALEQEAKEYDDIVQGNFMDSYKNITHKHIMAMHWFHHYCKAEFILKLDDDTFVNPYRLIEYIHKLHNPRNTIFCKVIGDHRPLRDQHSKYYTPVSQYPFDPFPYFCLGFAYLTTSDVWTMLYNASARTHFMSMDDVFVTGMLALQAGVHRVSFGEILLTCSNSRPMAFSVELLNKMAIVFDRHYTHGEKPSLFWNAIRRANS